MKPTKKIDHCTITGNILCVSGLRIGGSDDLLQIGGADLTCIRHPVTFQPYIPGTSIKGKMRSELEKKEGKFSPDGREPCGCARDDCLICRVFGPHKKTKHSLGPTRIIVRDAKLISGAEQIEMKSENVIIRNTGTAEHPRKVERVPAGAIFSIKIEVQIWDCDNKNELIEFIKNGLREIQKTGLGSGISKGSGEIEFKEMKLDENSLAL